VLSAPKRLRNFMQLHGPVLDMVLRQTAATQLLRVGLRSIRLNVRALSWVARDDLPRF
jgi:hypothetical protein